MKAIKATLSAVFVCLSLLFTGCFDSSSSGGSSGGADNETTKIVVIGDSIGTGFGVATGFPVFLRGMTGVEVINNSARSRRTGTGIGLASSLIAQHSPSHLVVLLGTNDAIAGDVDGAISNLQTIANIAKDAGVTAVIGTLPIIPRSAEENARAGAISSGIRGLSNANIAAGIRSEVGSDNFADDVHPNNDGQTIIAMNFAESL